MMRATVLLAVAIAAITPNPVAAQARLSGTWELTNYESTASVGKASGMLMMDNGRFSLVYTMAEPGGRTSGRAHAGRYTQRGDELILDVTWQVEQVSGKGSATAEMSRHPTRMTLDLDELTLTFANGGMQRFKRIGDGSAADWNRVGAGTLAPGR